MKYTNINQTDIKVSKICLGTMTYGAQNTEEEAHQQLDYAAEKGVNFIDTAEMYAVPASKETQGATERFIGNWIQARKNRDQLVLATKVAGPAPWLTYMRGGPKLNKAHILEAIDDSLFRLKTDYVDLYQIHWPDRNSNFFGKLGYVHKVDEQWEENFLEILQVADSLVKDGKVRHFGLSNESPWGLMRYLQLAKEHHLPKCVTVQNSYGLLNRMYEVGMAEISMREDVGLLAYSPLSFGMTTGKFQDGARPEGARLTLFKQFSRFINPLSLEAVDKYQKLAQQHNISVVTLALAFVHSRPFLTSTIIGATNMGQLKENIESIDITLSEEIVNAIEEIHMSNPNPAL